ncbi:MAG: HEAT repeat domain-containing protein [Bacteroidota bacterium]|nr:HEAT repeat domain-containing protein [Bacteroidota bacterium]
MRLRHVVQPHQTFNTIGRLYGLTGEQVADYNNLEFYEDEVLAKYLAIPLTQRNFSREKKPFHTEILVPVFRVNGSRDRLVLFKAPNGPHVSLSLARELLPDGFLHTSKANESIFRTVPVVVFSKANSKTKRDTALVDQLDTSIVKAKDAATLPLKDTSAVVAPATKKADSTTISLTAPVIIKKAEVLKTAVKKAKPATTATTARRSRPVLRVEKVFFLVKVQITITIVLVVLIFLYLAIRNKRDLFKSQQKRSIRALLIEQILTEESLSTNSDQEKNFFALLKKKLSKKANRQFLIDELANGRKNIKGKAGERFLKLYLLLHLEEDSAAKLKSRKWNAVAKGIQELSMMQQHHYMSEIFSQINSRNEHVRMEAQSALVQLSGFGGLWFLNVLNHPISEWQQMRLISMLSASPVSDIPDLHLLLTSTNDSLVIFTLKLIGVFQQRSVHNDVVKCLGNKNEKVRFTAIKCLREINDENTPNILIRRFANETRMNKIAIVNAVGELGNKNHFKYLLEVLSLNDDTLKITAAKALTKIGTEGHELLEQYCNTNGYPYSQIFLHIKQAV